MSASLKGTEDSFLEACRMAVPYWKQSAGPDASLVGSSKALPRYSGHCISSCSVFTVEEDGWFLQTVDTEWSCESPDIQEAKIPEDNTRDQELDVESFVSSPSVQRPSTVLRRLQNTAADQEPSLGESSSFPGAETPHASVEEEGSEEDYATSSPRVQKPKKWLIKKMMKNTYTVEDSSSAECSSTDEDDTMHDISSIEDEVWDSPLTPSSIPHV
ncbi:uncharacterized protein LOC128332776 [Hemicordylus capensis]|uniref:uncharacterized protein LOC128332776 n=1 Tax=Hemicordylus capensis TaxID=884348 RepID=UPI0023026F12|nr:uncharacterized protein LOC128332776 [Hemicordylus capensis]